MKDKTIKGAEIQPQSKQEEAGAKESAKIVRLVVFNLGDEEFGIDIDQVKAVMRMMPITPIPDSPDFIKGVSNVRGEIAVVIDLRSRLFLPAKKEVESKQIVMIEQEKNLFGLMVDEVSEILGVPETEIKTTPELTTGIDRVHISGVITLKDRLIVVLDLTKMLSEEEFAKLSEIRSEHRTTSEQKP